MLRDLAVAMHVVAEAKSLVSSTTRRIVGGLGTALLATVVLGSCIVLSGAVLGYRTLTIRSGSMTPTLLVGDVVLDRSVPPLQVHPGEIVTFRDPNLDQELVTHRVVSMHRMGDRVYFVTKGDANIVTEHWNVSVSGHIGREIVVLPAVGKVLAQISRPLVRVVVLVILSLWLTVVGLRWIWRDPSHGVRERPAASP